MVTTMADLFQLSHDHMIANKEKPTGATRPHDAQLDTSALEGLGIGQRTAFREGVRECLESFVKR